MYALDSCGIGSTHAATLVPIANSLNFSSVWESFEDLLNPQEAPFNYTNLNTQVPKSSYGRQMLCAAWYRSCAHELYTDNTGTDSVPICPYSTSHYVGSHDT